MSAVKNVLGHEIKECGCDPMTGWRRDGYCHTDHMDQGIHTVCGVVTQEFLEYARSHGNDLMTPRPEFNFPGLIPGDAWCLCAWSWFDAYKVGKACPVKLESCHEETLAIIPIKALEECAWSKA